MIFDSTVPMCAFVFSCLKSTAAVVTVGVVLATTAGVVLGYYFLGRKKKPLVTLQDPSVKYPLRLIDKEVRKATFPG